jgi:hypothetical protein
MYLQLNLQTRTFIIHITVTWTLSTMCALIWLQITCVSECFTAQIRNIWTCSTKYNYVRYDDVPLYITFEYIFYHRNHKHMDTSQYVQADVSSYETSEGMFYYTHHRHTDAGHYVKADVSSHKTCNGMFYYTQHTHKDDGHYV